MAGCGASREPHSVGHSECTGRVGAEAAVYARLLQMHLVGWRAPRNYEYRSGYSDRKN